jgi:hypothetical protein
VNRGSRTSDNDLQACETCLYIKYACVALLSSVDLLGQLIGILHRRSCAFSSSQIPELELDSNFIAPGWTLMIPSWPDMLLTIMIWRWWRSPLYCHTYYEEVTIWPSTSLCCLCGSCSDSAYLAHRLYLSLEWSPGITACHRGFWPTRGKAVKDGYLRRDIDSRLHKVVHALDIHSTNRFRQCLPEVFVIHEPLISL